MIFRLAQLRGVCSHTTVNKLSSALRFQVGIRSTLGMDGEFVRRLILLCSVS